MIWLSLNSLNNQLILCERLLIYFTKMLPFLLSSLLLMFLSESNDAELTCLEEEFSRLQLVKTCGNVQRTSIVKVTHLQVCIFLN